MTKKHIPSFDDFVNESIYNDMLAEGVLAKKGASEFSDINLDDQMDNAEDDEWRELYQAIADAIKEAPGNVIQIDSETNEDDPLSQKIYNYLSSHFNGRTSVETKAFKNTHGWQVMHDPKLNVVRLDDYGFVGFFFSANSKF